MKSMIIAAASAGAALALEQLEVEFMQYISKHNKSYESLEHFQERFALFMEKDAFIKEHNASNANFTLAHNQFSDMTDMERKSVLGLRTNSPRENKAAKVLSTDDLPASIDWRDLGAVNPIQDQGQCGSCWAFSATGSLEGAHFLASGDLLKFAESQLVDCANVRHGYINFGCNGGLSERAWNYWSTHDAILESDYPYVAADGDCQYDSLPHTAVETQGWENVTADDVDQVRAAVANQPISIAIEADKLVFQLYSTGIFDSPKCGTTLDHAVMIVGYGSENGQDYFILRNSWNTTWGEEGYMRIAAEAGDGVCGMNMEAQYTAAN